ncbi:MAG: N-acetylmuramoyl-L-alanine amidase family protein, partial [Candidatus Xenobia bacterium]
VGPKDSTAMAQPSGLDGFMELVHGCIVLDPGHGGSDPGCHSPYTGVYEKQVTLDICLKMKKDLEARGWRVLLTRDDDRDLTWPHSPDALELGARANVANYHNADLFVSIHCNASTSPSLRGTSIHWFKADDYPLAESLREALGDSLGVPMDGLIHSRFYVLRHTTVPAVLVETAYLTNPVDGEMLSEDSYRTQVAGKLADALCQYMTRQSRINGTHSSRLNAPAALH